VLGLVAAVFGSFNSRARMGRDIRLRMWESWRRRSFNSRARMGRDVALGLDETPAEAFQFTRPHGARRAGARDPDSAESFNSRARMGRDAGIQGRLHGPGVSIHAPAWGATQRDHRRAGRGAVSIHAPAWGATATAMLRASGTMFQFTRPHGARLAYDDYLQTLKPFQFTRPHGARLLLLFFIP